MTEEQEQLIINNLISLQEQQQKLLQMMRELHELIMLVNQKASLVNAQGTYLKALEIKTEIVP